MVYEKGPIQHRRKTVPENTAIIEPFVHNNIRQFAIMKKDKGVNAEDHYSRKQLVSLSGVIGGEGESEPPP